MPPTCFVCHSPGCAIYDYDAHRVPLCPAHAQGSEVVSAEDLPAVAASGICWCSLAHSGLTVDWCPHQEAEKPRPFSFQDALDCIIVRVPTKPTTKE